MLSRSSFLPWSEKKVDVSERQEGASARKKEKYVHKSRYSEERKIAKGKEGRKEGTRLDVADGVRRHGVESQPRAARYDATEKYTKVIHHRKRGEAARAARLAVGSCGYRWRRKVETVEVAGHPRCIHSNSVARLTLRRTGRRRCQDAADANCKCCVKFFNAIDEGNEFDKAIRKHRRESDVASYSRKRSYERMQEGYRWMKGKPTKTLVEIAAITRAAEQSRAYPAIS